MKKLITVALFLIVIVFVGKSYAIDLVEHAKELRSQGYTIINSDKLREDEIKKYLHINTNINYTKIEYLIYYGFKQKDDTATIYFQSKAEKKDYLGRFNTYTLGPYELVRLNSGYWFNVTRNRFVAYK